MSSPRRSVRPLARVLAALGVAALVGACGLIPKKVTKKDCEKWGEHFQSKMTAFMEKQEGCEAKEAKKALKDTLGTTIETVNETCDAYVDSLPYLSKDEKCFLDGSGTKDWKSCNFGMTTAFYMFNTSAEAIETSSSAICAGGKAAKDAEDDADKPAKKKVDKKKKKAADDE